MIKKLSVLEQIRWERDCAIKQLEDMGMGLGRKTNIFIENMYCWQLCNSTEHCTECKRLGNGDMDYYDG